MSGFLLIAALLAVLVIAPLLYPLLKRSGATRSAVIAGVIESRKADVYTRPDGHEVVARYYAADEVGV